jgi:hypothetical protein
MCTLHANSAREALVKMCTLPLLAGENVSAAFVVPYVLGVGGVTLLAIGSGHMGLVTSASKRPEGRAAEHWERLFTDQVNVALRRGRLDASVDAVTGTLHLGSPLAILVYGGFQVLNGSISLGTMLAVTALAVGFLEPLATLVETGLKLQLLRSYMERISDVLDASREQEGQNVVTAHRLSGLVRAEGVSFAYGPLAPQEVKDVSLEVQPGQHLGIAGHVTRAGRCCANDDVTLSGSLRVSTEFCGSVGHGDLRGGVLIQRRDVCRGHRHPGWRL